MANVKLTLDKDKNETENETELCFYSIFVTQNIFDFKLNLNTYSSSFSSLLPIQV